MILDFLDIGTKLIDKLIPDPAAKAQAHALIHESARLCFFILVGVAAARASFHLREFTGWSLPRTTALSLVVVIGPMLHIFQPSAMKVLGVVN